MRDLDYLKLLHKRFPTKRSALAEVINLKAILSLPKGNEFFFSDIHGEYQSFRNLVRGKRSIVTDSNIVERFRNVEIAHGGVDGMNDLLVARDKIL